MDPCSYWYCILYKNPYFSLYVHVDREELLTLAGDQNAVTFYKRTDRELERKVDLLSLCIGLRDKISPINIPLIEFANRLRQRIICVYDFGILLEPPIVTNDDTVADQLQREVELQEDAGQVALDAVCQAVDRCKIPMQILLHGRGEVWTPEALSSLSSTTSWYVIQGLMERGEMPRCCGKEK